MAEGDGIKLLSAYIELTTKGLKDVKATIRELQRKVSNLTRMRTIKLRPGPEVAKSKASLDGVGARLDKLTQEPHKVRVSMEFEGTQGRNIKNVISGVAKRTKAAWRKSSKTDPVSVRFPHIEIPREKYSSDEWKRLMSAREKVRAIIDQQNLGIGKQRALEESVLRVLNKKILAKRQEEKKDNADSSKLFTNKFNKMVERTNGLLREQRRQLGSLGNVGLAYRNQLERAFDYENILRKRLKAAQIRGDDKSVATLSAKYEAFNRKARATVAWLNNITLALRIASKAWSAAKATMTFGLSIVTGMIGGFARLAKTVAMVPINAFGAGLRALFAPTLGLLSIFRQLRSYATMIFGGGAFFITKATVEQFSEFEELVGRATGNIGVLGKEAVKTFSNLKSVAREAAIETLVPLDQVTRGMEELARGGIADPFEKATEKVLAMRRALENTARLSLISGIDTQDTAKLVAVITNQFGEVGKEADDLADTLAKAQSLAPVTLNDIRQAIEVSGSAARNAGLDFTEFAALLTQSMQRITSGSRSGTALSRTLIQSMLPKNEWVANNVLKRVGKDIKDFLDETGQRYKQAANGKAGGFTQFIEALSLAGAGIVDLEAIFGFKSREFINLLDQSSEGLLRMSGILKQLGDAQASDFTKVFEDFLKNNTLFGALRNLQIRFNDLKISLAELARGGLIRFFNQLAGFVDKIKNFVDTSGALRAFLEGVGVVASNLRNALGPVVSQFARISMFVNTVLIASLARLATIVARKIQPYFEKAGAVAAEFFGMGKLTFASWGQTFNSLAKILYNFEFATSAAIYNIKARLAELAGVMLKVMAGRDVGDPWQKFADRAKSALRLARDEFVAFSIFAGNTLAYSLEYAIKRLISSGVLADLGLEASRFMAKRYVPDLGIPFTNMKFNPIDTMMDSGQERLKSMRNWMAKDYNERIASDYAEKLESAVKGFADRQATILPKALGFDELYGSGDSAALDRVLGKLETARIQWEELRDQQIDLMQGLPAGLGASLKFAEDKLGEINRAYDRTIAKREEMTAAPESKLMGLEEFQKSLQDGAQYERLQVDEQKKTNKLLEELITTSKAIKLGDGRTIHMYPTDAFMPTRF